MALFFVNIYREINHRKAQTIILCIGSKFIIQPHKSHQREKESLFQKVVIQKVFPKGHYSEICNSILTYDCFGVKLFGTLRNLQNIDLPTCHLKES